MNGHDLNQMKHDVIHALAQGIVDGAEAGCTDTCRRLADAIHSVLAGVPVCPASAKGAGI